ncbi:uncharacterized protein LOC112638816 [Camponotus floridanus]|uniref:uncharacterized protein LOC112638816 n=1 Tax=Camponotus floridanus TaxID=104421 RepID=UPI000DC6BCEB|nr:uncharacterized protein LOC112638816 [Camponotus floridanus]
MDLLWCERPSYKKWEKSAPNMFTDIFRLRRLFGMESLVQDHMCKTAHIYNDDDSFGEMWYHGLSPIDGMSSAHTSDYDDDEDERYDLVPSHISKLKINIKFCSRVNRIFEKTKTRYRYTLLNLEIKDLNSKYDTSLNPFNNIDKTGWLINISNKNIPDRVSELLSLGDNFGLPLLQSHAKDRVNVVLETLKNLEINYNRIPVTVIASTRNSVANSLNRFLCEKRHVNCIDRYVLGSLSLCKQFLHNNDDLFVTRADKGQVTVVMNKTDYVEKMEALLNDQSTYRKLNKDPIRKLTNKINTMVKSWRSNDLINESTYKKLNSTNGNLPRCYGLPKIHKSGFPMRIIVSSIGSPVYNVAQYIHDILKISILEPKSHIKDGWTFANYLKGKIIRDDEIMISLDVTALFTNIPKDLVVSAVTKRWNHIAPNTKFNLSQFLYVIEMILDSTSFTFNGQFYEQIFGSPMGSPLSPILADIMMDDLETHCLSLLDFNVPVYYRYVDDIFTIVPRSKVEMIKSTFNNYHQRLAFTHEIECDSQLSRHGCYSI